MTKCILLVDDEIDVRLMIMRRLNIESFNKEVLQASNPLEAYEVFQRNRHRIDTIVCDQYMPIQNGTDFCALVKRDHPNIRIIILTGDKKLTKSAQSLNADLILYKPEDLEVLFQKLKEIQNNDKSAI